MRSLEPRVDLLEMDVRRLRALILHLWPGRVQAPAMDFMVDMFDRKDADSLGRYWDTTGMSTAKFAVRTKRAVCAHSSAGVFGIGSYRATGSTNFNPPVAPDPPIEDPVFSEMALRTKMSGTHDLVVGLYRHPATSADFKVKIVFDGPPNAIQQNFAGEDGTYTGPFGELHTTYNTLVAAAGVAMANDDVGTKLVGHLRFFDSPGGAAVGSSVPPQILLDAFLTDAASVNTPMFYATSPTGSNELVHGVKSVLVAVGNVLEMSAVGDIVTVSLNGTQLFSGTTALLIDRTRLGMGSFNVNSVSDAIANSLPFWGIRSFKAWRSDIPEPADQSGHGVYLVSEAVKYRYADAYHAPETDPRTNQLTGYRYNPDV